MSGRDHLEHLCIDARLTLKWNLTEIGREVVKWIQLAWDGDR